MIKETGKARQNIKPSSESVNLADDKDELLKQIRGFEREVEANCKSKVEYCEKVDDFLAGGHYGLEKDEMDNLANAGDGFGEWPAVPYTFEVIEKQVAALTRYQTRPKVVAEDAADFAMLPETHPFKVLAAENGAIFKRKTDNEIFAEIMSARLETAFERGQYDKIFEDCADAACRYRASYILVRFEQGNDREGAIIEMLDPCDVDIDPRAPGGRLEAGRFVRYRFRRTKRWIKENLDYEVIDGNDKTSYDYDGDSNSSSEYSFNDEKVQPDDRLVDVWCWFIRDDSTVKKIFEYEEKEMILGASGAPIQDPLTGEPIMRAVKVQEEVEVPRWRGGWKMVFKVQNKIVKIEDNPNASGRPPIHVFEWIRNPRKFNPISAFDLSKDANQAIDHALKYAIEDSNRSHTKILMKRDAVENPEDVQVNDVHGIIWVDGDGPITDAHTIVQPAPFAQAKLELASHVMNMHDKSLGVVDMREPGGGANRVTGDAVEGLNGADADRYDKRLRRWLWFKRDVCTDIMWNILEYEDLERTVVLGRDWGQPVYISFDRSVFDFSEWEFEARWDIVMREPDDLPMNRSKRNTAKLQIAETILSMPPNRAKMALKFLNLEDEAALRVMLEEEIEAMSQEPPPPTEIDIMQSKADIEVAKEREIILMKARLRASEGISDAMERIADMLAERGNVQQSLAVLALMPKAVEEAMSGAALEQNQAYNQAMAVQTGAIPQPETMQDSASAVPM